MFSKVSLLQYKSIHNRVSRSINIWNSFVNVCFVNVWYRSSFGSCVRVIYLLFERYGKIVEWLCIIILCPVTRKIVPFLFLKYIYFLLMENTQITCFCSSYLTFFDEVDMKRMKKLNVFKSCLDYVEIVLQNILEIIYFL